MSSALIAALMVTSINTTNYEVSACDNSKFEIEHAVAGEWPLIEDHLRLAEGSVKIKALVNAKGDVVSQEILETNPRRVFDRSATKAMSQWRFGTSDNDQRCFHVVFKFILERENAL